MAVLRQFIPLLYRWIRDAEEEEPWAMAILAQLRLRQVVTLV
jgi:hypothetical protein